VANVAAYRPWLVPSEDTPELISLILCVLSCLVGTGRGSCQIANGLAAVEETVLGRNVHLTVTSQSPPFASFAGLDQALASGSIPCSE
jgi:hypothetical protein